MIDLLGLGLLGLLSAGHCMGMCGGFALVVSRGAAGAGAFWSRQACYHLGKTATYVVLATVLALGGWLLRESSLVHGVSLALSVVLGLAMILYGLSLVGERRLPGWAGKPGACLTAGFRRAGEGPLGAWVMGLVNGLLPCGLLWMVLLYLGARGDPLGAATGAAAFGLATAPGLVVFGAVGAMAGVNRRRLLMRLAGGLLVLFGLVTLVRGLPPVHHFFHEHLFFDLWQTLPEWCRPASLRT